MTLRRLLLTALLAALLVGSHVLVWGPAFTRSLRAYLITPAQIHIVDGLAMAFLIALVVTAGTGRIWLATGAGVAASTLTIGVSTTAWGVTASTAPLQAMTAVLASAVLISFVPAASLRVAMDAIHGAWRVWSAASRRRDRLAALVPILGVFVVALSLTVTPDLAGQIRAGIAVLGAPAAGTLLPAPYSPTGPSSGHIVRDAFYSNVLRQRRVFNVYLPASYDLLPFRHRAYPVLYLLHGDGGHVDSWGSIGVREMVEARIAAGTLPELIVVMPDGSGVQNDETDWANRWDGREPVEDQVIELIAVVDDTYRTLPDRSFRFIGGLSSGGFGALNIALHHPDLFSVSMSFSGFVAADDPAVDPGVFGTDPVYVAHNSPSVLVRTVPQAATIYYVLAAGVHDLYFQARMRDFDTELTQLGLAHELHLVDGGHDADAWAAGLSAGLDYLGRVLPRHADPGSAR